MNSAGLGWHAIIDAMKMHLDSSPGNLISSVSEAGIDIRGQRYTGCLLVSQSELRELDNPESVEALTLDFFEPALEMGPELIVLGTGSKHRFAPPRLMAELAGRACPLEVMTTQAACRTYNVLVSERRAVVAILFPYLVD